jgi:hypothetical protein
MKLGSAVYLFLLVEGLAFSTPAWRSTKNSLQKTRVFGILDEINSGAFELGKKDASSKPTDNEDLTAAYEVMLAELVFSTNDPRVDIFNKLDLVADPVFLDWLDNKVETSTDPEERIALRDLFETIRDVKTKVEVNKLAEERAAQEADQEESQRIVDAEAQADAGRSMSNADVLKMARMIETQQTEQQLEQQAVKKTFYEQELTPEIRLSYESLLKKVLPPHKAGDTPGSIVFKNYDQFDAQFVKVLVERGDEGDSDARDVIDALALEQQKRIVVATEALKSVLAAGDPMKMEGTVIRFAREGKADESFLLLLEANENQARDAGAHGPADLMKKLRLRAIDEKDKLTSSKELRLIRKLLRTDDVNEREKILEDAFTPRELLLVPGTLENAQKAADGEAPEQDKPLPDVPPPDFINACKAILLNFGNLGSYDIDRGDLATRIKKLASEAEVVATRIYGKGMTLREQQDKMWSDQTTSIFDLETMEIEAERQGTTAPWANGEGGEADMMMPGFDSQGKMKIGGT